MWLCFNNAFVSAVADSDDPDRLVVRARRREHLESVFGDEPIIVNAGTDYKYRVVADRRVFADLVHKAVMDVNYTNFKASVNDHTLQQLYARFWALHYGIQ